MDNDENRNTREGSLSSIPESEDASDNWGAEWIERCRLIRDDASSLDSTTQAPDLNTDSGFQAGNNTLD